MNKKIIIFSAFSIIFLACSTKKNTLVNRFYHNKVGWFNGLFNANQELEKKIETLNSSDTDKYYDLLAVQPIKIEKEEEDFNDFLPFLNQSDNNQDSQKEGFAKVEEKAQSTIKRHSMNVDGKERNKLMPQAYLILGKSRYYNGEYIESLEALNYVNKNLKHLRKKFVIENQNYLALANHSLGNDEVANNMYKEILEKKLKKYNKKIVYKSYSQFLIDQKKYTEAIENLDIAYKYNRNLRPRIRFIQAQIYERLKDDQNAREYFLQSFKKANSTDGNLEIKSLIGISQLKIINNDNFKHDEQLMLKATKNIIFENQKNEIYYALANLYSANKDSIQAENFYLNAAKEKESDENIKAMNHYKLAEIYFKQENYIKSSAYYDSADKKIKDPKYKSKIEFINESMKQVLKNYNIIKNNDSILNVVSKNPEQRINYYLDHISKLKEKEKEEKEKQEKIKKDKSKKSDEFSYEGAFLNSTNNKKSDSKFYFYNANAKNKGITEFKQIWNERALTDNWRTAQMVSFIDNNNPNKDSEKEKTDENKQSNPRRFDIEYYLEKIPTDKKELSNLKSARDSAELALGNDYYDIFSNIKLANKTLNHLLEVIPSSKELEISALYNLYRINQKYNFSESEKYKNLILNKFPDSKFASRIKYPLNNGSTPEISNLYQDIYKLYEQEKYSDVINKIDDNLKNLNNDKLTPKFLLLKAFCLGKLNNKDELVKTLKLINDNYDQTEEAKKANQILTKLKEKEEKERLKLEKIKKVEEKETK